MSRRRSGSAAITAAANPMLRRSTRSEPIVRSAIWTVCQALRSVANRGQTYWFQAPRNEMTMKLPMMGLVMGMATRNRKRRWP